MNNKKKKLATLFTHIVTIILSCAHLCNCSFAASNVCAELMVASSLAEQENIVQLKYYQGMGVLIGLDRKIQYYPIMEFKKIKILSNHVIPRYKNRFNY